MSVTEFISVIKIIPTNNVIALTTIAYSCFTAWMAYEVRKSRQAEVRPYVILELISHRDLKGELSPGFDLQIRNAGKTAAKDLIFEFTESIFNQFNEDITKYPIFKNGIKYFPPSKNFKFNIIGLPSEEWMNKFRHTITIKYKGPSILENYSEKALIDADIFTYSRL